MTDPDLSNPPPATGAVRVAAAGTGLVVAAAAVTLSYLGLLEFAAGAGIEAPYTLLFPLTVIGTVAIGFLAALQAALAGERGAFGRVLVALGTAALAAGGVAGAGTPSESAAVVAHALPPVALLLTVEALLHIVRRYGPPGAPRVRRPASTIVRRQSDAGRKDPRTKEAEKAAERASTKTSGRNAAKAEPGRAEVAGSRGLGRGRRPAEDETTSHPAQPVGAGG